MNRRIRQKNNNRLARLAKDRGSNFGSLSSGSFSDTGSVDHIEPAVRKGLTGLHSKGESEEYWSGSSVSSLTFVDSDLSFATERQLFDMLDSDESHSISNTHSNLRDAIKHGETLMARDQGIESADADFQQSFIKPDAPLNDGFATSKDGVRAKNKVNLVRTSIANSRRMKNRFNVFYQ